MMKRLGLGVAALILAAQGVHALDDDDHDEWLDPKTRPAKCYGIALADATDFGPYQAGALIGLLKHQQKTGERYAVITGVAVDAINAFIMSTFDKLEIEDAIEFLSK